MGKLSFQKDTHQRFPKLEKQKVLIKDIIKLRSNTKQEVLHSYLLSTQVQEFQDSSCKSKEPSQRSSTVTKDFSMVAKTLSQQTVYHTNFTHSSLWTLQASWSNTKTRTPSNVALFVTKQTNAWADGTTLARENAGYLRSLWKSTQTISSIRWMIRISMRCSRNSNSTDRLTSNQQMMDKYGHVMMGAKVD